MSEYVIEMLNIRKVFPGIVANDNVTLQVKRGEIHALLGENGAGKSTLMSVLFGMYQPDGGEIRINGEKVQIKDPNDATAHHIGMVHQHFKLVHNFTALENIVLGVEPTSRGLLDLNAARAKLMDLTEHYGLKVDFDRLIEDMTVGMQQRVEILKMLYRDNDILIFDEPTAVLMPQEIDDLMEIMRNLAREGKSIIFISHKLAEIMAVADRCTVLWHGKGIDTVDIAGSDITKETLSEMMVGRKVPLVPDKPEQQLGEVILKAENLCVKDRKTDKMLVNNASFEVREGEIVCIAGIDGNGQSELAYAITGLLGIDSGTLTLDNEDVTNKDIRYRSVHGIAHIPEDRQKHGLVLDYNMQENCILKNYFTPEFQKGGFMNQKSGRKYTDKLIDKFDIRSGQGASPLVRSMSGGNQQKVIVAREIDSNPKLLVAVQPTRGLDVGAIEYIHAQLMELRNTRHAVLLFSLEMDEVLGISDRILVMYNGELVCNLDAKGITAQELGLYMAGVKKQEVTA